MFNAKKMIVSIFCLAGISFVAGCGSSPTIYGEPLPAVSLPAYASSWEETVTKGKTNSQCPVFYFDSNNQMVGFKTIAQSSTSSITVEAISDTLVLGQEVTLTKVSSSTVIAYFNVTLVEGSLVKNGNQVTITYKLSTKNPQDGSTISTFTTRTGTVSADGKTITITQSTVQSTPAQTSDTTVTDTSTWVLKTGTPLL